MAVSWYSVIDRWRLQTTLHPIDTPYGYKNPDFGIALRGPLSQFSSGIYLKLLDDAFNQADVTYLRYQDDYFHFM